MRKSFTIIAGVVICCASALADSIDTAEAVKRGVSVETVQLETAKQKIASLEADLRNSRQEASRLRDELAQTKNAAATQASAAAALQKKQSLELESAKAELAKAKGALSPKQQAAVAEQDEIAKAMKERRIVNGMTIDQLRSTFHGNDVILLVGEVGGVQEYKITTEIHTPKVVGKTVFDDSRIETIFWFTMEGGRVSSWGHRSGLLAK